MEAASAQQPDRGKKRQEVLLAQVRLLYENAFVGVGVTVIVAIILGLLQWGLIPHPVIVCWWLYTAVSALLRCFLAIRFLRTSPGATDIGRWAASFALAAGIAGAGWGAAGILLYPESNFSNQVLLIFVVGGMMLGAASLLAPRTEASFAFLVLAGSGPVVRLALDGDQTHVAMGGLAAVFTIAVLITTRRTHQMLESSLRLQFENRDLVESLRSATAETEALNQALERRVRERTAELTHTAEQLRDEIANRERTEEELIRARKLESLGVLAGGIAHDFNNFLTVVQGNIELAKSRLDPWAPVQEILETMNTACRRAESLSSQLLTFAKGGAPVRRLASIQELVTEAIQLVRAGSSISVTVDIAEDLLFAYVDPGQIGQALHNILLNARQAMPEGGIIEVSAENAGRVDDRDREPRVRIAVRDYGCGIPDDVRARIFDPYFTTKPGGSGLGLASAYAIVSKHGGNIKVESTPGLGSVFTIELPASYDVPAEAPPIAAQTQIGTGRLLVMDDEDTLRKLLESVLRRIGYEVQTARDGAEAIDLYQVARSAGQPFDVVLLDLTVSGGMGGVEAAAKLREIDPLCKLIVSSGYSASPVMADFAKYGFDAVLPKPWSMTDIGAVVRRVLAGAPNQKTGSH